MTITAVERTKIKAWLSFIDDNYSFSIPEQVILIINYIKIR